MADIRIRFLGPDGREHDVPAFLGLSAMAALESHDLVAGECGGSLACASCHVWLEPGDVDNFPPPNEDEEDMLDTAFHVTERSRLSCQLILGPEHDGLRLVSPVSALMPAGT